MIVENVLKTNNNQLDTGVLLRYQYNNHLGSAALELDETGAIVSYEEYHPYGTSAYQAKNANIKTAAKRYRYTGMERDEESGLAYHTARYYLPWLGRWLSGDPIGVGDGVNVYVYCGGNPCAVIDTSGAIGETKDDLQLPWSNAPLPLPKITLTEEQMEGQRAVLIEEKEFNKKTASKPVPLPTPDSTTQTEWVIPTSKHSPFSMWTSYDSGDSTLNFALNKLILPWDNLARAIANLPFEAFGELDDMMLSSRFSSEWQAANDLFPVLEMMGLGLKAPDATAYLLSAASTWHRKFAFSFLSMTGVMAVGGTKGSAAARTFEVSHQAKFYAKGSINAAEIESTLSGKGVYQLLGDHPPDELGQSVVRVGEGDLLVRFANHSHGLDQRVWRGFQVIANDEGLSQRLNLEADIGLSDDLMLSGEASSLYKLPGNPALGDFAGAQFKKPAFTLLNPALYPSVRKRR